MSDLGDHIEAVARHYWGEPNVKLSNGTELRFGTKGSKSVNLEKGCWYDHENDFGGKVVDLVRRGEGLPEDAPVQGILTSKFGISPKPLSFGTSQSTIITQHDYHDASGQLVYQVTRSADKKFRQRRPDGKGGFIFNLKGVDPAPYNLPMIMQASNEPVFVVEGEKCADALIKAGFIATTNSGGAGKWSDDLSEYLRGRNVIVLPDNDLPGMRHANSVVASLWGKANQIKRVDLPGLPDKGDVVDYLRTHTLDELVAEVQKVAPLTEAPPVTEGDDSLTDEGSNALEPFETLDQDAVWSMPPVEFLVDQLLPERAFTMMYGAPGSGKSFLAIDMALSVAHGVPWQGYKTKQGAALYIACEGIGGFGKRWKAWSKHRGLTDAPEMYVLPLAVNFMDEGEVTRLLYTIDRLEKDFAMVVVDTVHRSMHGAEENSASEMARFIDACDMIQRHTSGTMLAVHHSGKNSAQGARGSNSLLGAVSTSLMVGKSEDVVTLRVEKQKDAEPIEGDLRFNMLVVPASISETSVVLEKTDEAEQRSRSALTDEQEIALAALHSALIDKNTKSVHKDVWNSYHKAKAPNETTGKRRDARNALQKKRVIAIENNMCWVINGVAENM